MHIIFVLFSVPIRSWSTWLSAVFLPVRLCIHTHKKIAEKLVRLCALSIFLCIYPLFHSNFTFFISVFLQTILFISLVLEDPELTLSLLLDVRILVEE